MDLTKEDWSEWKAHPCTKAACEDIEEKVSDVKDGMGALIAYDTADKVALAAIYKVGLIDGARALLDVIEEKVPNED